MATKHFTDEELFRLRAVTDIVLVLLAVLGVLYAIEHNPWLLILVIGAPYGIWLIDTCLDRELKG